MADHHTPLPPGAFRCYKTPMVIGSVSLFFRIPLDQIGYVRAIVEAHEGLAAVRSAGANRGEIEWLVPAPLEEDARALARALAGETGMVEIARPEDWPDEGP
jgi:hypothetical protein